MIMGDHIMLHIQRLEERSQMGPDMSYTLEPRYNNTFSSNDHFIATILSGTSSLVLKTVADRERPGCFSDTCYDYGCPLYVTYSEVAYVQLHRNYV